MHYMRNAIFHFICVHVYLFHLFVIMLLPNRNVHTLCRIILKNHLLISKRIVQQIAPCICCYSTVPYITSKRKQQFQQNSLFDVCRRLVSSESGPPSNKLPPLMNFPQIIWPSLIKSIRNFILTTFIIKPYMDREFNLPDFVYGSKKAVEVRMLYIILVITEYNVF